MTTTANRPCNPLDHAGPSADPSGQPSSWPTALAGFDEHLRSRGLRHPSRKNYRHHLRSLATFQPAGPASVTGAQLVAWLDTRGGSRRTSYNVSSLFFAWAISAGQASSNPVPPRAPRRSAFVDTNATIPAAWHQPITEHANAMRAAGRAARTIDLHRAYLAQLAQAHPDGPWTVTGRDLNTWLAGKEWRPETRRSARYVLRAFYGRAVRAGHLATSPADDLDRIRVPRAVPRPAATDALTSALANASDLDRIMLLLGALAGLRAAEIAGLHLGRDLHPDHLTVTGKGGHQRVVPLHPIVAAELAAEQARRRAGRHGTGLRNAAASDCSPTGYLLPAPGGHMTPGNVTKRLSAVLPDGWTAHTLRHRFASQAYAATRDLRAVQELLGHASPTTTARYTQVPTDALRNAVFGAAAGL